MRVMILYDRNVSISPSSLNGGYGVQILQNTYPNEDGVAIISQEKEVDWSWPDYVVTIGNVEIGRHKRDSHIDPAGEDYIAAVQQILDSVMDSTQPAEDEVWAK